MMLKTMGALWLALAVGCVAPPEPEIDETSEVEQHLEPCPGCGGNGMRQAEWNYVFSTLDENALNNHGLWDTASESPVSLCKPGTVDVLTCIPHDGWIQWLGGAPIAQRGGIFKNLVKIILRKSYKVVAPKGTVFPDGSTEYEGKFGLMFYAREQPWGAVGREVASAGMLALLSAVPNVPICLSSRQKPNNCLGDPEMTFSESVTFGDALTGSRYMGIWGGMDARVPTRNDRYGTVSQESAAAYNHTTNVCDTEGSGNARYPVRCRYDGTTWSNPVHVLTPRAPGTWYYGDPPPFHPTTVWPQPI